VLRRPPQGAALCLGEILEVCERHTRLRLPHRCWRRLVVVQAVAGRGDSALACGQGERGGGEPGQHDGETVAAVDVVHDGLLVRVKGDGRRGVRRSAGHGLLVPAHRGAVGAGLDPAWGDRLERRWSRWWNGDKP
jgi:hypothetical protein